MKTKVKIYIAKNGKILVYRADNMVSLAPSSLHTRPFSAVKPLLEWLERNDYEVSETIWPK